MKIIENTIERLLNYCKDHDWSGFDPYDALNSRLFMHTPFYKSRVCRIAATQILKRLPFNVRPLLLIEPKQNPKTIALFLMAFVRLSNTGGKGQQSLMNTMVDRLVALRSEKTPYWCWGYSFPWQGRTFLVPRGAPNLVCTVFAANALLDLYKLNNDSRCLKMAEGAAEYILNELFWSEGESIAGFSYPARGLRGRVHNANFLGAALLSRVFKQTGEKKFLEAALQTARYSASKQNQDGSWSYAEHSKQRWIDNFHTGYNLCALWSICRDINTSEFEPHVRRGFEFYRKNFFRDDGAPKYYHNNAYPLDIHSVAQSIITLVNLKDFDNDNVDLAHTIYSWAIKNMWDIKGYFYYQIHPLYKNKISYMRWSQAWMLLALTTLLEEGKSETLECAAGYPLMNKIK